MIMMAILFAIKMEVAHDLSNNILTIKNFLDSSTATITIRLRRDFDRAANRDSGNVHYREADCRPLAHGPHCSP